MKKVILITGTEWRHQYFRKFLALSKAFTVTKTYCESAINTINDVVAQDSNNLARIKHLAMREQTEKDFFQLFCSTVRDNSNPEFIQKGDINNSGHVNNIKDAQPDLIVTYGCSIIKPPLIEAFNHKIVNIHLGLSPYYRGSGTNFWPFVNNEPEYAGASFMYMDTGIDTGEIIHQVQAHINYGDNIHQIGNRLIRDMVITCADIISNFEKLEPLTGGADNNTGRVYRNKDFTEAAVELMYQNFSNGLVDDYLGDLKAGNREVQLKLNPILHRKTVFA